MLRLAPYWARLQAAGPLTRPACARAPPPQPTPPHGGGGLFGVHTPHALRPRACSVTHSQKSLHNNLTVIGRCLPIMHNEAKKRECIQLGGPPRKRIYNERQRALFKPCTVAPTVNEATAPPLQGICRTAELSETPCAYSPSPSMITHHNGYCRGPGLLVAVFQRTIRCGRAHACE